MTSLNSLLSTHLRSAVPTVNDTRTVLQKLRNAVDRPVPPAAVVTLSPQATRSAQGDPQTLPPADPPEATTQESWDTPETQQTVPPENAEAAPPEDASSESSKSQGQASIDGLTQQQRDVVTELAQRDREVHTHEAAHQAAGGGLVGAASYTYQEGPDGRSYAIGGECPIQIPASDNPSEMIDIAQRVRAAALAPANPSGQDLAVANAAVQMEAQARQALAQQVAQQAQAPQAKQAARPEQQAQARDVPHQPSAPSTEGKQAVAANAGTVSRAISAYARSSAMAS
jgi:hypothetical protein